MLAATYALDIEVARGLLDEAEDAASTDPYRRSVREWFATLADREQSPALLVDTDAQGSLSVWHKARGARTPLLVSTRAAELPEVLETARRHKTIEWVFIDGAAQAGDGRLLDRAGRSLRQHVQARLGSGQRASLELAFATKQLQREDEIMPVLPGAFREQAGAEGEVLQRRGIGRSGLRAPAGEEIKLSELLPFLV